MKSLFPCLCLAALLAGCSDQTAASESPSGKSASELKPSTLTLIQDKRITESSGLAPSLLTAGEYWTHNDSGGEAKLFRFNEAGDVTREARVAGAENFDWEDLASAELDRQPYLFIGDIGNNSGSRKTVTVYRVPETTGETLRPDQVYTLEYDDEPRNAEALLVHPKTGAIWIVTKSRKGISRIYTTERPQSSGKYTLKQMGQVELGGIISESQLVTGGAFSPDGMKLVIRTYMAAYEYEFGDEWWKKEPRQLPTNLELGGESITYDRDASKLLTTAEGTPCQVSIIPLK